MERYISKICTNVITCSRTVAVKDRKGGACHSTDNFVYVRKLRIATPAGRPFAMETGESRHRRRFAFHRSASLCQGQIRDMASHYVRNRFGTRFPTPDTGSIPGRFALCQRKFLRPND